MTTVAAFSFVKRLVLILVSAGAVLVLLAYLFVLYLDYRNPMLKVITGRAGPEFSRETYPVRKTLEAYFSHWKDHEDVNINYKYKLRSRIKLKIPRYFFQYSEYVTDKARHLKPFGYRYKVKLHLCYPKPGPNFPCRRRQPKNKPKTSYYIQLGVRASVMDAILDSHEFQKSLERKKKYAAKNGFRFVKSELEGFKKYIFYRGGSERLSKVHVHLKRNDEGFIVRQISCYSRGKQYDVLVFCETSINMNDRLRIGYSFPGALWKEWPQLDADIEKMVRSWLISIDEFNKQFDEQVKSSHEERIKKLKKEGGK